MTTHSRRAVSRSGGSPRRQLHWGSFLGNTVTVAPGFSTYANLGDGFLGTDILLNSTLVRIRGEMLLTATEVAPTRRVLWAAAITIGTRDQAAIGITAFPDPENDDGDWLWYSTGYFTSHVSPGGGETDWAPRYIEINNKAMRKLHEREKVPIFLFKSSNGSGGGVEVGVAVRVLIMT